MAKGKKGGGEAKTPPTKIVRKVTDEQTLKKLLRSCTRKKEEIDSITGSLREELANAVEKKNLHAGAFAAIRRLWRKDAGKVAEFMDHFLHYYEVSGLRERAESAPEFDLEGEKEATGEAEAEPEAEGKPAAARRRGMQVVGGTEATGPVG